MKKTFLCIMLSAMAASAFGQNNAYWKAKDKMDKGELEDAAAIVEAAIENPKTTQFAKIYNIGGQIEQRIFNPELIKAANSMPFDTLKFCDHLDKAVNYFTKSEEANQAPNEKGKVKVDAGIQSMNKLYIIQMLDYYNYAGMFMNAMGNKAKSIEYFQKYADLPRNKVFTQTETDSIYAAKPQNYMQTRFNLAFLYYQEKDWKNTITACDEALKDTMGTHDLYLMKATAYGELKDSVAWQKTLAEAAQKTGGDDFQQSLLYYYMQNNKIDDATALANRLVSEDPQNKNSWFMKGAIELNVLKDYEKARESFKHALDIDPNFVDALYNQGIAYINDIYDQRVNKKFKYVGTDLRITGKTSDGSYQREKKIYDEEIATVRSYYENARPLLEKVRELTPDRAKLWAPALQMVYSSLGMKDEAAEMDRLLDEANKAAQQ